MNNDKNFEVISLLSRVNRSKILKSKNKKISGAYSIPDYRNIGYDIYNDYSLNTLITMEEYKKSINEDD